MDSMLSMSSYKCTYGKLTKTNFPWGSLVLGLYGKMRRLTLAWTISREKPELSGRIASILRKECPHSSQYWRRDSTSACNFYKSMSLVIYLTSLPPSVIDLKLCRGSIQNIESSTNRRLFLYCLVVIHLILRHQMLRNVLWLFSSYIAKIFNLA